MQMKMIDKIQYESIVHLYNIILITINSIEYSVAKEHLQPIEIGNGEIGFYRYIDDHQQEFVLGKLGKYNVALTKVLEPGTTGQHSIGNMIHESLFEWPVKYVFMIGICATADEKKYPLGTVIISKEIIAYERVKYEMISKNLLFKRYLVENTIDRAPRFYPGLNLKQIDTFITDFKSDYQVKTGVIMSGEKLMSSKNKLKQLKALYPNAIALEMEGSGFASALHSIDIHDWVVIKGVSDNAMRKKGDDHQEKSMRNVMSFCENYFDKEGIFARGVKVLSRQEQIANNVLISGSLDPNHPLQEEVEDFSFRLSQALVKNNYKIISGYGLTVGSAVVAGAYQKACDMHKNLDEVLDTFPFPRVSTPQIKRYIESIKDENRVAMINETSSAIFIYGQKVDKDGNEVRADGVWDEFVKASKKNRLCIPVGKTGFIAQEIWQHMNEDFDTFFPDASVEFKRLFQRLNDGNIDTEETIKNVLAILKMSQKR